MDSAIRTPSSQSDLTRKPPCLPGKAPQRKPTVSSWTCRIAATGDPACRSAYGTILRGSVSTCLAHGLSRSKGAALSSGERLCRRTARVGCAPPTEPRSLRLGQRRSGQTIDASPAHMSSSTDCAFVTWSDGRRRLRSLHSERHAFECSTVSAGKRSGIACMSPTRSSEFGRGWRAMDTFVQISRVSLKRYPTPRTVSM